MKVSPELSYSSQSKPLIVDNEIRGCKQAQVWKDNKNLACIEPTKDEKEASEYARLFSIAPKMEAMLKKIQKIDKIAFGLKAFDFDRFQKEIKEALQ